MNAWDMTEEELQKKGAGNTAKEICQQPDTWEKSLGILKEQGDRLAAFLDPVMKKHAIRVIFTGAGTSAFVGDFVAPFLREQVGGNFVSIATTDIVPAPLSYLRRDVPTLLVSFARSGNSPESVGAFDLAETLVDDISQLVITCNPEGALAKQAKDAKNGFVLLTPPETDDLGFAMTSSFTNMALMALMVFDPEHFEENAKTVRHVADCGRRVLAGGNGAKEMAELGRKGFERMAFLGSGALQGLARETHLKVLELTGGRIAATWESIMGFRHGPKSILTDNTLVVLWLSSNPYTHIYDLDFLQELRGDAKNFTVVAVGAAPDEEAAKLADIYIALDPEAGESWAGDGFLALGYVLYDHILALAASMAHGVAPDTPCPSGSVNRVVKGVTIHPFQA